MQNETIYHTKQLLLSPLKSSSHLPMHSSDQIPTLLLLVVTRKQSAT